MVRVFQSYTVALNGAHHLVDGFVLCNNLTLQFLRHAFQSDAFLLSHALYGNARHHRNDISHLFGGYRLTNIRLAFQPLAVQLLQFLFQHRLTVSVTSRQLKVLVGYGLLLFGGDELNLLFLLGDFGRNIRILQMYARAYLVQSINRLVGHEAVVDISCCQFDTCLQRIVGVAHVVMILVTVAQVVQNLERLFVGRGFYLNFLETALQGSVFLNRIAVFVQRGGTDTLYRSSGQCGFQNVGCVH